MLSKKTKSTALKSLVSLTLVLTFLFSAASGIFSINSIVKAGDVFCNVKYSKPAICCDAGEVIDLTQCGVQFSPSSAMTTSGIEWKYNGVSVTEFTPSEKGVYILTATAGEISKEIYVVAKDVSETEYVLYRNDFTTEPTDFRVLEQSSGATVGVSWGVYIVNASNSADSYVRVLLPEFLDDFGDVTIEASTKMSTAVDNAKWSAIMYRVQDSNYPYMQCGFRYDTALTSGIEITERTTSNVWNVVKNASNNSIVSNQYNIVKITTKGTSTVYSINGHEYVTYSNTPYATGAIGFQTRGTRFCIDYIQITLDGNEPLTTSCDVSYAKPAIRADIGDTVDLTSCDVQFKVDKLYTKGSDITWKNGDQVITTFTPTEKGVTTLTATYGDVTKNIYVVTRNLDEREYVLYYNDFTTAPTDFRDISSSGVNMYHDAAAGTYVMDASSSNEAHARVLLPAFLDEFGDIKMEARVKESAQYSERSWNALMFRIQNNNYPYMLMTTRYNTSLSDGVEVAKRNESDGWTVFTKSSYTGKSTGNYNTVSVVAQSNNVTCYYNGQKALTYSKAEYVTGAMGLQAKALISTVDYVKVTLGETTAKEDTSVKCAVAYSKPAIGCNAGQTILLSECYVQFVYGSPAVSGSEVVWKKDGNVITEFECPEGLYYLTATHGDTTLTVIAVGKKTVEFDYVLYFNDFSSAKQTTNFRVIETSNGGSAYCVGGEYVLNGSASADAYVRVLLPSYLDIFGDVQFEASVRYSAPVDSAKWGALMYRVQNADYPYMQGCLRYDASAESGIEISRRTESNLWSVTQKGSYASFNPSVYTKFVVNSFGKTTNYILDWQTLLTETNTSYARGAMGFQVRGLTMSMDYVKVSFTKNSTTYSVYTVPGNYVDVRDPETGINIAPALITEVKTMSDLENISINSPAIAIMTYDFSDGVAKIVLEDGVATPAYAMDKLGGKIIPAFRLSDADDAESLSSFLKGKNQKDAFAVSTDPAVVKKAYDLWNYTRGVVDYSSVTSGDAEDLRYEAVSSGARVLILSQEYATKEVVTFLQDSYASVWIVAGEGKTASVEATNKGPYGIITPDRALTESCYEDYYLANTLVRRTNVVGHRGNPSVAQENTIASALAAYANGATAVENDIYLCTDGVLMVMHDGTIDRTTNGSGYITNFSSTQLKNYVVDYRTDLATQPIPSLEDYFKTVKGDSSKRLVVEIKHPNTGFAQTLANLITKYDIADQMVIIAFDLNNIIAIRNLLPGIPVGYLNTINFDEADPVYTTYSVLEIAQGYNGAYNPYYGAVGYNCIRDLAYRGVTLWPWTINDQNDFDRLFIEGVGGVTTDYSQWSANCVENLTINSAGKVIATTYGGTVKDVSTSAELVVVEDTLGISFSNGVLNVPNKQTGGYASYFFRYKSTTGTGKTYYVVSEVKTIEIEETPVLELVSGSKLTISSDILTGITPSDTVASIKAQFKYEISILDGEGNIISDTASVPTGSTIHLEADKTQTLLTIMKGDVNGDGVLDATDYLRIKYYFLGKMQLSVAYFVAADCDEDGVISATDYLQLKSHFLGEYNLFE